MSTRLELPIELETGVPSRDGLFWCGHCSHVVELSQHQVDAAEAAPAGALVKLKCPKCKRHEVEWRFPTPPSRKELGLPKLPVPVSFDHGLELFAIYFHQKPN